jgi:cytosolic iron-sulfur protein assembly protein CIAO1
LEQQASTMGIELSHKISSIAELVGTSATASSIFFIPTSFPGHDDRAWHVSWNPTKPLLATCSADKSVRQSVRLYTYTAGLPPSFSLHTSIPTGHTKTVRGIAWSPSGSTLATASFDANIGIWKREGKDGDDEEAAGEWECISILEGHETECKSVAWSSSGNLLASCSRDKTVWVWEGARLHITVDCVAHPDTSPT